MTNQHGGAGRGQGRKSLAPTEPTKKVTISLLASQVEAMTELGNGNLSAGVRRAIETMNDNTYSNSANAICNHCGGDYDAGHGNHICMEDDLEQIIYNIKAFGEGTRREEGEIEEAQARIVEVKEFWRKHPNHKTSTSNNMPA